MQVETKTSEPVQLVIPALLKNVKVSRHGLTVTISFQLTRLAEGAARSPSCTAGSSRARARRGMKPGRRKLVLTFQRKRWPDALSFKTKELTKPTPVPATGSEGAAKTGPSAVSTSVRRHG